MWHYTIELPKGVRNLFKRWRLKKRLAEKLKEYIERCAQPKNQRQFLDGWHKMHVLSALLNSGRVDTAVLAKKMEILPEFDLFLFERACNVISAYVCGAEKILTGGTGLSR